MCKRCGGLEYQDKDLGLVCWTCGRARITRKAEDLDAIEAKRSNHAFKMLDKQRKNWQDSPSFRWEDYEEVEIPSVSPNYLVG